MSASAGHREGQSQPDASFSGGQTAGSAGFAAQQQQQQQTAEFFLSNYRLGKTLGIGSFGKVKVAEHVVTGHKVAIKILNRRKIQQMDMDEKVRREIKILRLFMHPHIIRLYEVIDTPNDIYVVMEYVKTGELFDYIVEKGRLMEDEARHFFQQIISGVEYCHRNMVVHRDLKPENLLLDNHLNVKIADFGLSNIMRDGHFLKTSCGSPNYAAPEVISGKLYAGPEVDVWSCGVILYALLCGSLPFDDENIPNLFKKIKGGIYNLPSHLSPGARDLIPRMLLVDPLKRITIPEIRQHPWFNLHLPRYLAVMQADNMTSALRLDEEVISEVIRLGFDRELLVDSIRNRQSNKATVTYYLMVDNRQRGPSNNYLNAELSESAATSGVGVPPGGPSASALHPAQQPHGSSGQPGSGSAAGASGQRLVAERKWRLGVHARGHPSTLMAELYRVLQHHGVSWKKLAPYNLKCRRTVQLTAPTRVGRPTSRQPQHRHGHRAVHPQQQHLLLPQHGSGNTGGASAIGQHYSQHPQQQQHNHHSTMSDDIDDDKLDVGSTDGMDDVGKRDTAPTETTSGSEHLLKFEASVYKVRDDEYVIDIQRVSGDLFIYMDICGRILSDVRM